MAVDKLVDSAQLESDLTSVADAIRAKGGTSAQLAFPAGFVSAVEAIPTGGGSSAISLLDTITVSANTRAVNLDLTPYSSYDFVSVFFDDVNIGPSGDWIYFVRNGSSPSGGTYTEKQATFTGLAALLCLWAGAGFKFCSNVTSSGLSTNMRNDSTVTNLYMYCYTSSCYFTAGSTIKIYGGNYADI